MLITADNAYGLGIGSRDGLREYFGPVFTTLAAGIFNCDTGPERYVVPAAEIMDGDVAYVVAWSDRLSIVPGSASAGPPDKQFLIFRLPIGTLQP